MTRHHRFVVHMRWNAGNVGKNLAQLVGVSVESAAVHAYPMAHSFIMMPKGMIESAETAYCVAETP